MDVLLTEGSGIATALVVNEIVPDTGKLKAPPGPTKLRETIVKKHASGPRILGGCRGFDAHEPQLPEGLGENLADGLSRVTVSARRLGDAIAKFG